MSSSSIDELARLIVEFGANVQPGQIVSISSEPGKEPLHRAIAAAAYGRGAKFVDLSVFDVYLKRARALHASTESLGFVPPWYGARLVQLAELHSANVSLAGPVAPDAMEGVDPTRLAMATLVVPEANEIINARTTNWTVAPCPTADWATLVHPELGPEDALARLWSEVAHICRLDEDDTIAAWEERMSRLTAVAAKLDELSPDALRFEGPGTDLTVGLFRSSRWISGRLTTVDGIMHAPNLPTEEVFTTPDPERVDGVVTATKPLFVSGAIITGLRVRFEGGRAVEIDADRGAQTLRKLSSRDAGAARLGEVALVDGESRIGGLGTVFFETLLDENAASHIALGAALEMAVTDEHDLARANRSELHIDFMIGADEVSVTAVTREGSEVPLLRGGHWQL